MAEAAESTIEVQAPDTGGVDINPEFGTPPVDGDPLKAPVQTPSEKLLAGKYKTVEDLEKGYSELNKAFSAKNNRAPEQYAFDPPDGVELNDEDYALFKDLNLNDESAQKLVTYMNDTIVPQIVDAYTKAEVAELGRLWNMDPESSQFGSRVDKIQAWAQDNLPAAMVAELSKTAEGMQSIVAVMESNAMPTPAGRAEPLSKAQIDSMVQDDRYWTDEAYRQEVASKLMRG